MRTLLACCAALTLVLATPASARPSLSVGIFLGNAPPPPLVVFDEEPPFVYVPSRRVYVVDDDDVDYDYFRCGGFYYIYNDGYWYRSRRYGGPFAAIRTEVVPRSIFFVDDREYRWRHHPHGMPPGQARKLYDRDGWGDGRRHGHGHGHGGEQDDD